MTHSFAPVSNPSFSKGGRALSSYSPFRQQSASGSLVAYACLLATILAALFLPGTALGQSGDLSMNDGATFPRRSLEDLGRLPEPANDDPVARSLAETYEETGRARTIRRSSYVLYPYGQVEPVLVCAPLRSSVIELERGEQIIAIIAGDTQRWMIQETATGASGETPLVAVKPTDKNLTTNLMISTNRRIYDITLDSPANAETGANPTPPYTSRLDFYYPEAFVQRKQRISELREEQAEQRRQVQAERQEQSRQDFEQQLRTETPVTPGVSLEDLNFDYSWDRDEGFPWAPAEVFDDGRHTYIKLSTSARGGEIPLLFDVSRSGEYKILNYSIRNNTFIVDRVFKKAALVLGIDKRKKFLGIPLGEKKRVREELVIYNHEPISSRVPPKPEKGNSDHKL